MDRITRGNLEYLVRQINAETGSPAEAYAGRDEAGRLRAAVGHYHISGAYGGVALHRTMSEGGGVEDVFGGHIPKRELYGLLRAFLAGLRAAAE